MVVPFFVALHVGAGYHDPAGENAYRASSRRALAAAAHVLQSNPNGAVLAAVEAVACMEDDPLLNAGYGSNLNAEGRVECDAAVVDGKGGYGAVGAVSGLFNPIRVAHALLDGSKEPLPLGLEPPVFLAGDGARQWAMKRGLACTDPFLLSHHVTAERHQTWKEFTSYVVHAHKDPQNHRLDTVGAVCVDASGGHATAVSSGGMWLKVPGRVGQAAILGAGCWCKDMEEGGGVACCTTGRGESLLRSLLAREAASVLYESNNTATACHALLSRSTQSEVALLGVSTNGQGRGEVWWGHGTRSLVLGYITNAMHQPRLRVSRNLNGHGLFQVGVESVCFV